MKINQMQRPMGALFLSALLLAGCVDDEIGQLPEPLPPEADACGALALQYLVGQNSAVLAAVDLPHGTRIIPPGTMVTMDYQEDRLNLDIDEANRITRVYCS